MQKILELFNILWNIYFWAIVILFTIILFPFALFGGSFQLTINWGSFNELLKTLSKFFKK